MHRDKDNIKQNNGDARLRYRIIQSHNYMNYVNVYEMIIHVMHIL